MKKLMAFGLLLTAVCYSCKKDASSAPHSSGNYITATIDGVHVSFDSLADAYVDTVTSVVVLSGFVGVPKTDTLMYSGGFQQTLSDYIYLWIGYEYGKPISTGEYHDTAMHYWVDLNYAKYINTTSRPNYYLYGDVTSRSSAMATVTSVADSVIEGTFQGTVYAHDDPSKMVIIKDGKFKAKMWHQ
ncbi:DUF5025 domain-containing protein [Flavitalea sp. BT771]|uniref:DUF5025 domain-containing protein n=1 Tax=Flavitalea sp. BT771 TaxID=3063329 RepID=UPI0026E30B44|nr:DUF5025 domain-containing protein [Flavitalea sp. BT771]MDO6432912.1 DUF5025 domain-containing protein [Flavitalea sp. BT771]MDV6221812.1 DUF5025 domain-containing protein [Flavitalea sp. BT771]